MPVLARLASTLLFGLAANADNLTIGAAYGMKRRRIGWPQNLLIAVVTTGITLIALAAGHEIRAVMPAALPDRVGGILLIALAAWSGFRERADGGKASARPMTTFAHRPAVGLGEALYLSGALSINNIGLAIAGGIGGIGYLAAAAAIAGCSIAMLALGQALGMNVGRLPRASKLLRDRSGGNAVLALAGVLMLAGY